MKYALAAFVIMTCAGVIALISSGLYWFCQLFDYNFYWFEGAFLAIVAAVIIWYVWVINKIIGKEEV